MALHNKGTVQEEINFTQIRRLFLIGICGAILTLVGDMLLGYGVHDASKNGMERFLSSYITLPDSKIFWSAFLGFLGIPLEAISYFGICHMIQPYSSKHAKLYRCGILGELAFAGCGVHVPCLSSVFFYKHMHMASPDTALDLSLRFGMYFLLPGMILFLLFWTIQHIAHIVAFAKGLTPYPRWCWIFCPGVGMAFIMLLKFLPETALRNAMTAAWISFGNLWMFIGLLVMMKSTKTTR